MRRGTVPGGLGKHCLGLEKVDQLGMGLRVVAMGRVGTLSFTRPHILALKQHLLKHRLRQPRRQGTHRQS